MRALVNKLEKRIFRCAAQLNELAECNKSACNDAIDLIKEHRGKNVYPIQSQPKKP